MTIPASKLAVIAMHELLSCVLAHGGLTNYGNASRRVGRAVQAEWGMDALKGARNRFQVFLSCFYRVLTRSSMPCGPIDP